MNTTSEVLLSALDYRIVSQYGSLHLEGCGRDRAGGDRWSDHGIENYSGFLAWGDPDPDADFFRPCFSLLALSPPTHDGERWEVAFDNHRVATYAVPVGDSRVPRVITSPTGFVWLVPGVLARHDSPCFGEVWLLPTDFEREQGLLHLTLHLHRRAREPGESFWAVHA